MMALNTLIRKGKLPNGATVIDCGGDYIWSYSASGIPNVFVKGGLKAMDGLEGYFQFANLTGLHDAIADHFLAIEAPLKADVFRFIRKEMLLTVEEAADLVDAPRNVIAAWEDGRGFSNGHPEQRLREIYSEWRKSRVRPSLKAVRAA